MTEDIIQEPLKIAILGTASSSVKDAPCEDPTWKIWSLGYNASVISRGDKWFEIHDEEVLKEVGLAPVAIETLRKAKSDLIAYNCGDMFPDATKFPFELVMAQFPRKYFTSSIAWMLGLAIIANPKEIALYGVDMCDTDEYSYQRGACEYMIGFADAKGIKVTIAKNSPICRTPRQYAYEDVGISRELIIRRRQLISERDKHEKEFKESYSQWHYYRGRYDEANDISNRWR